MLITPASCQLVVAGVEPANQTLFGRNITDILVNFLLFDLRPEQVPP